MAFNTDLKRIVAEIKIKGQNGTGFLIAEKYLLTARHNVIKRGESIEEKEVEVSFCNLGDQPVISKGRTVGLEYSVNSNTDVVLIELENKILDVNFLDLIEMINPNEQKFEWETYGYPETFSNGYEVRGIINKIETKEIVNNKKVDILLQVTDNNLERYNGYSGAPIIVNNKIIGMLVRQDTNDKLEGISVKLFRDIIDQRFDSDFIKLKELRNNAFKKYGIELCEGWFKDKLDEAIKIAGPRYTPNLNVNTILKDELLYFSRRNEVKLSVKNLISDLKEKAFWWKSSIQNNSRGDRERDSPNGCIELGEAILSETYKVLEAIIEYYNVSKLDRKTINKVSELTEQINNIRGLITDCMPILIEKFEEKHGKGQHLNRRFKEFMAEYHVSFPTRHIDSLKELEGALKKVEKYIKYSKYNLSLEKKLLLTGVAGVGKTHSICDLAKENLEFGIPSIIFYGQYFRDKSPEEVIQDRLDFPTDIIFDDFLYELNNIGEDIDKPVILYIDAINETSNREYWQDYLESFLAKFDRYKWLKIVLSCRTTYLDDTFPDEVKIEVIEHTGFKANEFEAYTEYFRYYNLENPSIPPMQKEFSNPLFLKMYCETLAENKEQHFLTKFLGINDLIEEFLKQKNRKISKEFKKLLEKEKLIHKAVELLALEMHNRRKLYLSWGDAKELVDGLKPSLETEFFQMLISENLLKEDDFEGPTISFAFERLFEFILAEKFLENYKSKSELEEAFKEKGDLFLLFESPTSYRGLIEAIVIIVAERYHLELFEIMDIEDGLLYEIILDSFYWRSEEAFSHKSEMIIRKTLMNSKDQKLIKKALLTIISLSLRPKNLFNARYFHKLFKGQPIVHRDAFLGYWLLKGYSNESEVKRIVDWAIALKIKGLDIEIMNLWSIILSWFCGSNDLDLRDYSSKALSNIFYLYPEVIIPTIEEFRYVDDDYISERIWGAIYGSLIKNRTKEYLTKLVDYIWIGYFQKGLTNNAVIRDYMRGIAELSVVLNCFPEGKRIEDFRPPYSSRKLITPTKKQMKDLLKEKNYQDLHFSCTDGDFNKYTLNTELSDYPISKEELGRVIYRDVLEMGYNERLEGLDEYIGYTYGAGRGRDHFVERVGKKYQKICLNRIIGQIKDNYCKKRREWIVEEIIPFEQALGHRGIDQSTVPNTKVVNDFITTTLNYDFRLVEGLPCKDWLRNEDVPDIKSELTKNYHQDDWILLKAYFDFNSYTEYDLEKYPYKNIWFQIRSYLIEKEKMSAYKEWVKDKNFMGRWMPEGYDSLYEGWLGEYPWSPHFKNILRNHEQDQEVVGGKLPFKLISTTNEYSSEGDSDSFRTKYDYNLILPSVKFFSDLDLKWNGENGYLLGEDLVFISSNDKFKGLYVKKEFLDRFLKENDLTLVWTNLGMKQIISKERNDSEGEAEISESYVYENENIQKVHSLYKINIF
ncbi:trypsin-like serine protease (plasmid) [Bacillus sp. C-3-6]